MRAPAKKEDIVEKNATRLAYLDNIRNLLTILVVMHHVAITYGSRGSWYYFEHSNNSVINELLSFFTGMNQMYFMGFFFLIAGFFTPHSYDRKGTFLFLKDRFMRLGIPLLVYTFTINPVLEYIKCITKEKLDITFWEFYNYNTLHFRNIPTGTMWFVEALLIFSCLYAICRILLKKAGLNYTIRRELAAVGVFIAVLAVFTFVTRLRFPMGLEVHNFQIAYFPQYICMFIAGIIAQRTNLFEKIPDAIGKAGLIAAVLSVLLIEGINALTKAFSVPALLEGGFHWQSLVISVYHAIFCTGVCLGILILFRNKFNRQEELARVFSKNSYVVYVIHAPVVVILAYLIRHVALNPLAKFGIVSAVGLSVCLFISYFIISRIPFLKRIV